MYVTIKDSIWKRAYEFIFKNYATKIIRIPLMNNEV